METAVANRGPGVWGQDLTWLREGSPGRGRAVQRSRGRRSQRGVEGGGGGGGVNQEEGCRWSSVLGRRGLGCRRMSESA